MLQPNDDFPNGAVLVTGGSGGIGRAICLRLAEAGLNVALTYRKNQSSAEEVLKAVEALGQKAVTYGLDTIDEEACKTCIDDVATRFGGLHTLVYASGPDLEMTHISRTSPAEFRHYMLQDAVGFYNLVFPSIKHLRASKGAIVAVHTAGLKRYPAKDILSVEPKAAVEAIVRGVAKEEGRFGIRANGIAVGGVEAGMHWRLRESGHYNPETLELARKNRSLPYGGRAEDVAEAVLYLASPKTGRYVTGQSISVCGGYAL
jgi:3-oxoacyl-[acyl-carrier protein] reductase